MKSKAYKKRHRLHITLMSVFIVSCLLFMSLFTVFTVSNTKEKYKFSAMVEFKDIYSTITDDFSNNAINESALVYDINSCGLNNDKPRDKNLYIGITDDKDFNYERGNYLNVTYGSRVSTYEDVLISDYSFIDFEKFRKSMTDEQYNTISEYLTKPADENGFYYALRCTKYYAAKISDGEVKDIGVLPVEVTLVKTCDNYTWFVQDDVVRRFELKPDISEKEKNDTQLRTIGETYQNTIDTDFFLGDYAGGLSKDDIKNLNLREGAGVKEKSIDLFSFVIADENVFWHRNILGTALGGASENISHAYLDENGILYDEKATFYTVTIARKINVLDYCLDTIITGLVIILLFFVIIVVLESGMWKISKTRLLQEQSRLEMTRAVAHNLKTPLFVISGFSENLKKEEDKEKQRHIIEVIQQQTVEMNTLVHRMLDMSKLSSTQISLNKEKFSLNSFVSDLVEDYRQCSENEIVLDFNSEEEITADKSVLKMAIENLIDNAVKYSDFGFDIVITIDSGYFSISNKCKEYSEEELKNLWKPYYRQTEGDNTSGNGIGLSTVKTAFELHKFKYGAEYKDGKICFRFKF